MKEITVCKTFTFAAGHFLPYHAGLCKNPHGHNYRLEVEVSGIIKKEKMADRQEAPDTGMLIDFGEMKRIVANEVLIKHDHKMLNDIYSNPTAEIMVDHIFDWLERVFWDKKKLHLKRVRLWETDTSWTQASKG